MIRIHRILCPTDFSEFSARALHRAVPLARWYEAEITALHVVPPSGPVDGMSPYFTNPLVLQSVEHDRVRASLPDFVAPARAAGLPVEVAVREGGASQGILDAAGALPADLVVVGTHGRGGFPRWVLGSVAETVLRKAPCPVLTVSRHDLAVPSAVPFKRILCATDFSPAACSGMQLALSLAQEAQGTLILVHVPEGPRLTDGRRHGHDRVSNYGNGLADDAWRRLRQSVPPSARDWCHTEEVVRFGRPHDEIVRIATERTAQLIVMGVHGRSALDLMLFGSNTHHVIREAPCPVLTIRGASVRAAQARAAGARAPRNVAQTADASFP